MRFSAIFALVPTIALAGPYDGTYTNGRIK
jgi:hypothetical protein